MTTTPKRPFRKTLWIAAGLTLITGYDYMRVGVKHMA